MIDNRRKGCAYWLAVVLSMICLVGEACAGVVIGATRVVVREANPHTDINLRATGNTKYLVVARVLSHSALNAGETTNMVPGFMILPSAFVIMGGQERQFRITSLINPGLPHDRESMMYLMVSSVPESSGEDNSVQIAIRTWIKLFYRPEALEGLKIPTLTVMRGKNGVVMKNASPFYVPLSDVEIDGVPVQSPGEVEPFGEKNLPGCSGVLPCELSWMQAGKDNQFTRYKVSLAQ